MSPTAATELNPQKTLDLVQTLIAQNERVHSKISGVIYTIEKNPESNGGGFNVSHLPDPSGRAEWFNISPSGHMVYGSASQIQGNEVNLATPPDARRLGQTLQLMRAAGVSADLGTVLAS